jgi:hypothetical protein
MSDRSPFEPEKNPRKAIHMNMPDDDYFVDPKASIRYARKLWRNAYPESPLYQPLRGPEPVQVLKLSDDATARIYDAPGLDGVVWGEVTGAVTDTFLGLSDDPKDLIRRAQSLDLNHLIPDA